MDPLCLVIVYKCAGLLVGLVSIVLGYKLFMAGVGGMSSIETKADRFKLRLTRAAPGLFFALFGTAIIAAVVLRPFSVTGPGGHQTAGAAISAETAPDMPVAAGD